MVPFNLSKQSAAALRDAAESEHDNADAQDVRQRLPEGSQLTVTLLDLVTALVEAGADDAEVVEAVTDLVETHRVKLVGVICDEDVVEDVA